MPSEVQIKSIRSQLPVRYHNNPWVRGFMLAFAILVCAYSLFFMIRFVSAKTPFFFKAVPLVIMFVGLDSILRQLTSLNCILFLADRVRFSYLAKRKVEIPYEQILKIELYKQVTFYLHIRYRDGNGHEQLFKTPASFPKIIEIILNIADLSPHAELESLIAKGVEQLRAQAETDSNEQV